MKDKFIKMYASFCLEQFKLCKKKYSKCTSKKEYWDNLSRERFFLNEYIRNKSVDPFNH